MNQRSQNLQITRLSLTLNESIGKKIKSNKKLIKKFDFNNKIIELKILKGIYYIKYCTVNETRV